MRTAILAAAALLLAPTPSPAQQVPPEIAAALRRLEQAFNRGDAAGVAAVYTENATILPPGAEMARGRQAIQAFWQQAYDSGFRNLSTISVEVETHGDVAREIGRFSMDAPGQGGQATRLEGKYVGLWKRAAGGGGWQLDIDIWNTNR